MAKNKKNIIDIEPLTLRPRKNNKKKAWIDQAKRERRSLNNLICQVMDEYCEKKN